MKLPPCQFTHDGGGNPLPPWILDGRVAYAPMRSKLPSPTLSAWRPSKRQAERGKVLQDPKK